MTPDPQPIQSTSDEDWQAILWRVRDAARAEVEAMRAKVDESERKRDRQPSASAFSSLREALATERAATEAMRTALTELVDLKDIKERLESWRLSPVDTENDREELRSWYITRKGPAWADARAALALAASPAPGSTEGAQPECDDALTDALTEIVSDAIGEDAGVRDPSTAVDAILAAFRSRGYWRLATPTTPKEGP